MLKNCRLGLKSLISSRCSSLFVLSSAAVVVVTKVPFPSSHALIPVCRHFHSSTLPGLRMSSSTPVVVPQHVENVPSWFLPQRTKILQQGTDNSHTRNGKSIVYWMQRDVRTEDNWALLYADWLAQEANVPLRVVYCLNPPPEEEEESSDTVLPPKYIQEIQMTKRYGSFLLGGLELVHEELKSKHVPFQILMPSSPHDVGAAVHECLEEWQPQCVVCDHSPLKPYRQWMEEQLPALFSGRIVQVDAHNVVPVWHAAPVRQIGARTLRPKINKLLDDFLTDYPKDSFLGNSHIVIKKEKVVEEMELPKFEKQRYIDYLKWDESVEPVDWAQPGRTHAMKQFDTFCRKGLKQFHDLRNDPNHKHICSNMSPWTNHGQISFQRLAKIVKTEHYKNNANGTAMYMEEGLIRRELSDNYVYYEPTKYDSLEAALGWAQETLEVHSTDEREWVFSTKELEEGRSHDDLWNAAQLQLVQEGKLHGFLRMYWAKKILEWTESPQMALSTAQYFNDKYAIDGCDPNGYVGVGWSIMGIHDQGWKEREIFGKIRYMNYAGCKRKFDVASFVKKYPPAAENAATAAQKHRGAAEDGKPTKKRQTTDTKSKTGTKSKKQKTSS